MTAAILLAAGESTRMGRTKALLPWRDTRAHGHAPLLIEFQVRELRAAGIDDLVVVLGHDAEAIRPYVEEGAAIAVNEAYREGRASSLRAGAAALPDSAGPIVILSVDQPRTRENVRAALEAHARGDASITVPTYRGHRGHPVVLAGALLPELREASEEAQGLRGVIAAHEDEVREVEIDNEQVVLDINTPEEYAAALRDYGTPV
ncbi:MAG: nucleotidyltransferase family protein [Dehalococcoidia bacterium]